MRRAKVAINRRTREIGRLLNEHESIRDEKEKKRKRERQREERQREEPRRSV